MPGEAEQVVAFVEGQMQTLRDRGDHLLGRVRSALPLEPAVVVGGDVAERGDFFAAKTGGSAALPTREADVFRLERLSLGLGLAAHLAAAGAEVVMPVRNLARARGGREDQAATTWGISLSPTCCPYCARDARATSQISVAANQHAINWNDLNWERSYHGRRAYSQSKIAFGLFGLELDRRSRAGGWGITSNLRHRVENSRAAGFG